MKRGYGRGIESNVVDGPISWRAPQPISAGGRKRIIWSREACGGTRAGLPEQNSARVVGHWVIIPAGRRWRSACGCAGPILARIELMWLRTVPSAHTGVAASLFGVETSGDELGDFELAVGQAGERRRVVPASTSVSSNRCPRLALPSSTRLPSMTCVNAGGMAATSVLIR